MADLAQALATQLANIEKRTGKSLSQLAGIMRASGLAKHGELRDMLKRDLGMGHGDANTLVHHVLSRAARRAPRRRASRRWTMSSPASTRAPRRALRPIHDTLMSAITQVRRRSRSRRRRPTSACGGRSSSR